MKGGESNEKEHITSKQPAPVLDIVLGLSAEADEMISSVPADATAYCHLRFPVMVEDTLSWQQPVLDPVTGNIIDFYGPCDHDPTGLDEIESQRRVLLARLL
jgi:hypothetical protein